jgi:phosphopantothenoylcysteine decarboxylase/phosphopantothenate--cysteine ligase
VTRRILITAGPTREKIDPIRFISNYSTGAFGYHIAREAARRGHAVTLVSGPTALKAPAQVRFLPVESAAEMKRAVLKEFKKADCVIMAAAVSDWRLFRIASSKIKRRSHKSVILELVRNPDILGEMSAKKGARVLVGFALETDDLEENALQKLKEKNLDLIVANKTSLNKAAFGDNKTDILMIDRDGRKERFRGKSKKELAKIILDKASSLG